MAERKQVIAALIAAAREAEDPGELSSEKVDETLRQQSEEAFGDWSSALAAGLFEAAGTSRSKKRKPAIAKVERRITDAFEDPFYVETWDGKFYSFHGPDLPVSEEAQDLDKEVLAGAVRAIHYVGDSDAVFLFTSEGRFFGLDQRMIPTWDRRGEARSIRDVLFLPADEGIRSVVPRREMATGRVIHVTSGGKGKASSASEFGSGLDRSGQQGFKIRDGDEVVNVMGVAKETTIFCASAYGKGIHFEASEMRSMGLNAMGVNVMKIDEDDAVVAAFEGKRVRQLAVISEEGLGKRVDFSDFRTQGRNGAGMQLAKLNSGDRIAGVVACNPGEDLALTSSEGRVWRLPAANFPLMGRPAKGNTMIELADEERIIDLEALPCGG